MKVVLAWSFAQWFTAWTIGGFLVVIGLAVVGFKCRKQIINWFKK